MKTHLLLISALFLTLSVSAQNRIFIKQSSPYLSQRDVQGILGHENDIAIAEASFGVKSIEDGRGRLRAQSTYLTIKFLPDEGNFSYPLLFGEKHRGTNLNDGEIIFEHPSPEGTIVEYQRYKFDDFVIVGTEYSAERSQCLIVDFYVKKLEISRELTVGSPTVFGWDYRNNIPWSAGF